MFDNTDINKQKLQIQIKNQIPLSQTNEIVIESSDDEDVQNIFQKKRLTIQQKRHSQIDKQSLNNVKIRSALSFKQYIDQYKKKYNQNYGKHDRENDVSCKRMKNFESMKPNFTKNLRQNNSNFFNKQISKKNQNIFEKKQRILQQLKPQKQVKMQDNVIKVNDQKFPDVMIGDIYQIQVPELRFHLDAENSIDRLKNLERTKKNLIWLPSMNQIFPKILAKIRQNIYENFQEVDLQTLIKLYEGDINKIKNQVDENNKEIIDLIRYKRADIIETKQILTRYKFKVQLINGRQRRFIYQQVLSRISIKKE